MNSRKNFGESFLDQLAIGKNCFSKRISSWDRTGKNYDWINIGPNKKVVIADIKGPGCIKHFYSCIFSFDPFYYRNIILRMFWDGEKNASVEVPLGDFFGVGHCKPRQLTSFLLNVNLGDQKYFANGLNSYFPMPFSESALIEIENESDIPLDYWYHLDYQEYDVLDAEVLRFHAQWKRENPTRVSKEIQENKNISLWEGINKTGKDNYVILDAKGDGQLVGILLNVDNIIGEWWGEGDDMVFIDGENWPPSLHGTGTEEIFGGGACPNQEYCGLFAGMPLISYSNHYRQTTMYRFFVTDPIRFRKSIKYTIEHGHANNYENDYTSVAYWYQKEPHEKLQDIFPAKDRSPVVTISEKKVIDKQIEVAKTIYSKIPRIAGDPEKGITQDSLDEFKDKLYSRASIAVKAYSEGRYDLALKEWEFVKGIIDTV